MAGTVLVTGATGLIGHAIATRLAASGRRVRALVRDPARAAKVLAPGAEPAGGTRERGQIELVAGDVTDPASLVSPMRGTELVFHAAGHPEQWMRDEAVFDRVNRQGTANVLAAALAAGVSRVVHTSTMDVFAAPRGGTLVETSVDALPKPSAYERSKQAAEREVEAALAKGLDVVLVNPAAIYGPGPTRTGLNGFFVRILEGKVPMLPPGGLPVVFVDGCADAHLAAAERGRTGERHLVADTYVSNAELAGEVLRQLGAPPFDAAAGAARRPRKVPPTAPEGLLKTVAAVSAPLARAFGFRPLLTPGELQFVLWEARVDARKARAELGFTPTPLAEGVRATLRWLLGAG